MIKKIVSRLLLGFGKINETGSGADSRTFLIKIKSHFTKSS